MSNRYFVWKNPKCNGINPEWVELKPQEFYAFVKCPLNKGRYFIDFNADSEEDTEVLMMEVTAEEYADWDRRRHQYRYRREIDRQHVDNTISLDQSVPNGQGLLFHEVIADETRNTETTAIHLQELAMLRTALGILTTEERALINALFFDNPEQRGERAIAREFGLARMTMSDQKKKIFKKIKNISVQ